MTLFEKEQQIITWLKEYKWIQASIKYLNETINDIAEANMGVQYDKEALSKTNKLSSVVENAVITMDKFDITYKIKVMKNIIKGLDAGLDNLNETEKNIIIHRYMKNECYYQFIGKICVSERAARRIKKEALFKLAFVIFGKECK